MDNYIPFIMIGLVFVFVGTFRYLIYRANKNHKREEVPYHLRHDQDLKHK
jgi:hypothetical protein